MLELLPSILETDPLKFKKKIDIMEGQTIEIQLDIMDGIFVPSVTLRDPAIIRTFKTALRYELHLH